MNLLYSDFTQIKNADTPVGFIGYIAKFEFEDCGDTFIIQFGSGKEHYYLAEGEKEAVDTACINLWAHIPEITRREFSFARLSHIIREHNTWCHKNF